MVKDKAYWKQRREAMNKLPEHPCAKLQQRALACSTVAGDARQDVCATAFADYKACLQEVRRPRHSAVAALLRSRRVKRGEPGEAD